MLARNWRGVAVQLVKWYQYMAVCWQLNGSHHIEIFKAVHLDSYIICDLWSAVLQPQVIPYSGLNYFFTLSLNRQDFRNKHFLSQNVCFDFLYNIFLKNFRLTPQCITLLQEMNTIFIDRLLTCRVFRRVHPTVGSEYLTVYHEVSQILRMKRHIIK